MRPSTSNQLPSLRGAVRGNGARREIVPPLEFFGLESLDIPRKYAVLRRAAIMRTATFEQVAEAWFAGSAISEEPEEERHLYAEIFPELLELFRAQHGGAVGSFFGRNLPVAAALTDVRGAAGGDRLPTEFVELSAEWKLPDRSQPGSIAIHTVPTTLMELESDAARDWLGRCEELHYHALGLPNAGERNVVLRMVFSVVALVLSDLDRWVGEGRSPSDYGDQRTQETVERELAQIDAVFQRAQQRAAQVQYLVGITLGLPIVAALAALVGWVASLATVVEIGSVAMAGGVAAGGLGAAVSVMNRITAAKFSVSAGAPRSSIRLAGALRVLIGAVFGMVSSIVVVSGVLPVGHDSAQEFSFYVAIGFLAGFSERWVEERTGPKA